MTTRRRSKVTLGGTNSTTPITLTNVAAGKAATDAVNVNQLKALGGKVDSNGNALNSFVAYDDTTKGKVTFGGTNSTTPVTLANVAAGKADTDAVNVKQLNAYGVKTDSSGNVTNAFVAYDSLTTKDTVTLEGKSGTKITNLTAGAVNSTSKDAINGSQLYNPDRRRRQRWAAARREPGRHDQGSDVQGCRQRTTRTWARRWTQWPRTAAARTQ